MRGFTTVKAIDWLAVIETACCALSLPLLINPGTRVAGVIIGTVCLVAVLLSAALFALQKRRDAAQPVQVREGEPVIQKKGFRSAPKGYSWDRTGKKPRLVKQQGYAV
jgi:hypothetical protein